MKPYRCSILLVISLIVTLQQECLLGQIAGHVPQGSSINYTSVELRIIENDQDTITFVDLDGDGAEDVQIWLIKGNPPSDASNMVMFRTTGNRYSFCVENESQNKVVQYNFGDTLCAMNSEWGIDSLYVVGCYAGWNCSHDTAAVYDKFVAYRNNSTGEIGWLKISMSLYSQVDLIPVTFTISEMLVLYLESNVYEPKKLIQFEVMPNPTIDGKFVIKSEQYLSKIEVYSYSGQHLIKSQYAQGAYNLPEMQGIYFVRAMDGAGNYAIRKIVRL